MCWKLKSEEFKTFLSATGSETGQIIQVVIDSYFSE